MKKYLMAEATTAQKNRALEMLAANLLADRESIMAANHLDRERNPHSERLALNLDSLVHDIATIIGLSDPVGEIFDQQILPNGLQVEKCRTPLGVLGVIYEARPHVTIDITALAIKSGNCAILRGGSEAIETNRALFQVIKTSLPEGVIQFVDRTDRASVMAMLKAHDEIDLIIPRGGPALQQFCRENSTIPVITGGVGICHLFLDTSANLNEALKVIVNAKTNRPTVCNALDTLLVHKDVAFFIPRLKEAMPGVIFRDDEWDTEWLSLVMGIKVVNNLSEAIAHIRKHSSGHSDGILTDDPESAATFVKAIDSAVVYVNASTRFTDGGRLGLGSEVAVSTQKFHARGPMGLKELTSYKWIVRGEYQCVS